MKVKVVYTDTYGGEPNFSWVREVEFETKVVNQKDLIRKVKSLLGISVRHTVRLNNDEIYLTFNRCNLCLFISVETSKNIS